MLGNKEEINKYNHLKYKWDYKKASEHRIHLWLGVSWRKDQ